MTNVKRAPRLLLPLLLAMAMLVPTKMASAQSVDTCVYDLSDEDLEAQTNRILSDLREHRAHARRWRFTWLGIYVALAGGASILAAGIDRRNDDGTSNERNQARYRGYLGAAIGAGLYAMRLAFYPMPDVWGVRRIERQPNGTRAERMARLRYAENVYQRAGTAQKLLTGTTAWATSIGWGLGWGGSITRNYDEADTAALAFLGAPILGAITILTAPNWANAGYAHFASSICTGQYVQNPDERAIDLDAMDEDEPIEDDWEDPGMGDDALDAPSETPEPAPGPSAMVYPTLAGAGMHISF